jgi:hypothetical protein
LQTKLQKAQQQREYAQDFHADALARISVEQAAAQEAAALKGRLRYMRQHLADLAGLNAERRRREEHLQQMKEELEVQGLEFKSNIRGGSDR